MRTPIVQQWVTIDNIATDEDGGLSFVPGALFSDTSDPASKANQRRLIDSLDTLMLGANACFQSRDSWPTAEEQGGQGENLNNLAKFVASSKLEVAPRGDYPPATMTRDRAGSIRKLKKHSDNGIRLWGNLTLMYSLMDAGAIREVRMLVCPASCSEGMRNFEERHALKLLKSTGVENGIVLLRQGIDR